MPHWIIQSIGSISTHYKVRSAKVKVVGKFYVFFDRIEDQPVAIYPAENHYITRES